MPMRVEVTWPDLQPRRRFIVCVAPWRRLLRRWEVLNERYLLERLGHFCIRDRCAIGHRNLQPLADFVSHGAIERLPLGG
jgi:hypothetical protein